MIRREVNRNSATYSQPTLLAVLINPDAEAIVMASSKNRRVSVFLQADTFCSEGTGTWRMHELCAYAPVGPLVVGSLAMLIAVTSGPVER